MRDELYTILGPLFLICTLVLSTSFGELRWDLLLLTLSGLCIVALWPLQGFAYWLVVLSGEGLLFHLWKQESHLWHLGLEFSTAAALFVTALLFEERRAAKEAEETLLETKTAAIENLEEELAREKSRSAEQQIAFSEKVDGLQKELEEIQAEQRSLLILNEVLRKTAACRVDERREQERREEESHLHIAYLQQERLSLRAELKRCKAEEPLVVQNRELMEELNAVRVEKSQAHFINETLVRLHAKEVHRAEQISSPLEARYKQLRKQFEEKDQLLHQARSELFHTKTALETLKIESAQKEPDSFSEEELVELEEELSSLQKENEELISLVTHLNQEQSFS